MKYTNKLNLPEVFVNIYRDRDTKEPIPHRYSVTELLSPIRVIKLSRVYYKEIEEDISECIPALFGSAVHKIFEEHSNKEEAEVKLEYQIGEDIIVGVIDHVKDDLIEDYKTCSVSKVTKKDFSDHELQIKLYAYLRFKKYNIITRKGKLYYLMKDWSKVKATYSSDYPKSPVYTHEFDIQDSDYDYIEGFIHDRLALINQDLLPSCSDEEKWYTGTKYAVFKKAGDKRAAIVCDTEQEAHDYITNKCDGAGEIEVRKGNYLKCDLYCNVSKFCNLKY